MASWEVLFMLGTVLTSGVTATASCQGGGSALGISESLKTIPNSAITASTQYSINHASYLGRLNGPKAWSAKTNDANQYLQIDLTKDKVITGVATQGRAAYAQWVKTYQIQYSTSLSGPWKYYPSDSGVKTFQGNTDKTTVKKHDLETPFIARYVRFRPKSWYGHISMRAELYGCDVPPPTEPPTEPPKTAKTTALCQGGGSALGISESLKTIPNSAITASTQYSINHASYLGRLNGPKAWSAKTNDANQYLQIDLSKDKVVTGVATQGRADYSQWVKTYQIQYSTGLSWKYYPSDSGVKNFQGNTDRSTIKKYDLETPFIARYVRFRPKSWYGHISMRAELYGCDVPDVRGPLMEFFQKIFDLLKNKDMSALKKYIESARKSPEIVSSSDCNKGSVPKINCDASKIRVQLINAIDKLPNTWSDKDKLANVRRSAILTWLMGHKVSKHGETAKGHIEDVFSTIYKLVKENNEQDLAAFVDSIPVETAYMVHNENCSSSDSLECMFFGTIEQLKRYKEIISSSTKSKVEILRTDKDYRELLKQTEIQNIRKDLQQSTFELKADLTLFSMELKKAVNEKFSALSSYFTTIADYDRRIAEADIGYITGSLDAFDKHVKALQSDAVPKIKAMWIGSVSAATAELAQKVVQVAVAWFQAANPFKPDPLAVIEAVNDVASATINVVRSAALRTTLNKLSNKIYTVGKGFSKNYEFLQMVHEMIKSFRSGKAPLHRHVNRFLAEYNNYSPAVLASDIEELGALWDAMIDESCDILFGGDTAASSIVAGVFAGRGDCVNTGITVAKLMTTYGEMYDFQFDFMDSMAAVVRAHVAEKSATGLNDELGKLKSIQSDITNLVALRKFSLGMIITSRLHTLMAAVSYCSMLEYKNGGTKPSVCKDAIPTLDDTAISNLIAYNPRGCDYETLSYVNLPTKLERRKYNATHGNAFIPLKDLYTGKQIVFKIPDTKWLVDNGWIAAIEEKGIAFYVSGFEIFLPDHTSKPRIVYAESQSNGAGVLFSGGKSYRLTPTPRFPFEYMDNAISCRLPLYGIRSPYNLCQADKTSLCIISSERDTLKDVYPSVFTTWKISVSTTPPLTGYPNFTPSPLLQASVRLCRVKTAVASNLSGQTSADPSERRTKRSVSSADRHCCPVTQTNHYWSQKQEKCIPCPGNSKVSASGYYCSNGNASV